VPVLVEVSELFFTNKVSLEVAMIVVRCGGALYLHLEEAKDGDADGKTDGVDDGESGGESDGTINGMNDGVSEGTTDGTAEKDTIYRG